MFKTITNKWSPYFCETSIVSLMIVHMRFLFTTELLGQPIYITLNPEFTLSANGKPTYLNRERHPLILWEMVLRKGVK